MWSPRRPGKASPIVRVTSRLGPSETSKSPPSWKLNGSGVTMPHARVAVRLGYVRQDAGGECPQAVEIVEVEPLEHQVLHAGRRVEGDLLDDLVWCPDNGAPLAAQ